MHFQNHVRMHNHQHRVDDRVHDHPKIFKTMVKIVLVFISDGDTCFLPILTYSINKLQCVTYTLWHTMQMFLSGVTPPPPTREISRISLLLERGIPFPVGWRD